MRKADLAEAAYRRHGGIPRRQALEIVDTILNSITRSLDRDERVVISGFGSFHVRPRGPRRGRNPQTGEAIWIPAAQRVVFRPSEKLVARLNVKRGRDPA